MPYLETVQELLEAKEGEHVQFKEAKNRFDFGEAAKCCCALANNGGGKLVFGITDKRPRSVVGSAAFDQPERTRMGLIEKLKVNVDPQFLDQAHAGTLRLVKSCAPDHAAGSLVRDAKYQLTAAIVRQSTAALRHLSEVKPFFGFLELDVFALFGFQKLLYSF